ncbi:MAG: relaxase domain-containing protein [Aquihabitans sp.]
MLNIAPCHDPEYALREVTRDASEYYLREGESPGQWWGYGATALGLGGEVDAAALRDLFAGLHPNTGEYLVSARSRLLYTGERPPGRSRFRRRCRGGPARPQRGMRPVPPARRHPGRDQDTTRSVADSRLCCRSPPRRSSDAAVIGRASHAGRRGRLRPVRGRPSGRRERLLPQAPDTHRRPTQTVRHDGRQVQYLLGRRDERRRWRVSAEELGRFMAARSAPRPLPAYDLVMRAPKSVGLLHALGHLVPPAELERLGLPASVAAEVTEVTAAHHAAVGDALELLQRYAAWVRSPGRPGQGRWAGGRPLRPPLLAHRDPLLHAHAVIANVATGVDGRQAALDGTALLAWASTAGHVYQAHLRSELVRIHTSRHHNMKELRSSEGGALRVLFMFDPRRQVILLLGGDESGRWNEWYQWAVPMADRLYDDYLDELSREGLI